MTETSFAKAALALLVTIALVACSSTSAVPSDIPEDTFGISYCEVYTPVYMTDSLWSELEIADFDAYRAMTENNLIWRDLCTQGEPTVQKFNPDPRRVDTLV